MTSPIIGARNVDQLDQNLGALGWRLGAGDEAQLDTASRISMGYSQQFHSWMSEIEF